MIKAEKAAFKSGERQNGKERGISMTHKIKMIGLDLDGTLLTDKKELTVRTREVLAKAIRSGIVVLVATGRPWMGVPEELREFPGMNYALTSNGARIIDTRTGNVIEKIKDIIIECLDYEGYDDDYEVSLSFVDNKEIHELNKQFRGIDRPTDVLSFPMLSDDFDIELEEESLGDIVISLERAFEQSKEYNHSFEREVCFLVCHSTFHLLGYDHDTEENTKQMREKEEYILNKLNITRE